MLPRVVRWLGWSVVMLGLLYAFVVLGAALWLRARLTPDYYSRHLSCWTLTHTGVIGLERYRDRPATRDWTVVRTVMPIDAQGHPVPTIQWHLSGLVLGHVYKTYWPDAERQRLFADVAGRMRPCGPWRP